MNLMEYQRRVVQASDRVASGTAGVAVGVCELAAAVGALASTVARAHGCWTTVSVERDLLQRDLGDLIWRVATLAAAAGLDLGDVASGSLAAVNDLYGTGVDETRWAALPVFDASFPDGERFPRQLMVAFRQHVDSLGRRVVTATVSAAGSDMADGPAPGQPAVHPVGVPLGDPLTDNARTSDGYRFHDAIHLGFLAALGWSPNLRALLHVKRKSDPTVDGCEDGARAIFAEEGLAAVLARLAPVHDGFRTPHTVTREAVEVARAATVGLEVHTVADLDTRTLTYRPPSTCFHASDSQVPPPSRAAA